MSKVSKKFFLKMEEVKKWLNGLSLSVYYEGFIDNGYDDLDAIRLDSVGRSVIVKLLNVVGVLKMKIWMRLV